MKVEPNGGAISIQAAGTIGVGKSLTVSLLCRLFMRIAVELLP
jgi:hypothetical protein